MTLKVGEFSRLARVSVKALRLYDRLGLLKPAWTDASSGYRYYSGEQLPRLDAILSLKDLGFSLEQIRRLLDEGLSRPQVRAMLEMRRDEAERALQTERERLLKVEARLERLDGEDGGYEVVLKRVKPRRVAFVREKLSSYSDVGRLFGELGAYAERHGLLPGTWISVWYDEEFKEKDADGAAAFATDDPLPSDARVREGTLPVADVVCTAHHGPFAAIGGAYAALLGWIAANGYRVSGPNREVYLHGEDGPDRATEVQFPVAKTD